MNHKKLELDKDALSVLDLSESTSDREYWLSQKPEVRFAAIEFLRQLNYKDYEPTTSRLQRVLEIAESV